MILTPAHDLVYPGPSVDVIYTYLDLLYIADKVATSFPNIKTEIHVSERTPLYCHILQISFTVTEYLYMYKYLAKYTWQKTQC